MNKIGLPAIVFLFLACSQPLTESKLPDSMSGVYSLQSTSYAGEDMDTTFPAEGQVKIFSDKFYMFGAIRPDTSAFFGFGSYVINDSIMTEKNIYNSYALDSIAETRLNLSRSALGFSQIQKGVLMRGSLYNVGETYKQLPVQEPSQLDGAWEQVSFFNAKGKDTTRIQNKQYKMYSGGHFMWIHRYPADSSHTSFNKGYGYGNFTINGKTLTEIITASNYLQIVNAPITVSFDLKGNNELQLIFDDGNSVTTEIYRRLQ